MLYSTTESVRRKFRDGDEIWAFAFTLQTNKTSQYVFSEPVRGRFSEFNNAVPPPGQLATGSPRYFVPYNAKGQLSWSKAVTVQARNYADTKEEATAAFNMKVNAAIRWMENRAAQLEAKKLPTATAPKTKLLGMESGVPVYAADRFDVFAQEVLLNIKMSPLADGADPKDAPVYYDTLDCKLYITWNTIRLTGPNPYCSENCVLFTVRPYGAPPSEERKFAISEAALCQIPGFEVAYERRAF